MIPFDEHQYFAGLIASGPSHAVAVLDRSGALAGEFEFGEFGWREFQEKLAVFPGAALAAEALEGHVLDQLFLRGLTFFPVTPANMAAHLERAAQPEEENPRSDARVLAEALRARGRGWKTVLPQDPLLEHFRRFWDAEKNGRTQVAELTGKLFAVVKAAFPEVLPVFNWLDPAGWEFVEKYPGAAALRRSDHRELEKFLRARDLWGTPGGERCVALFAETRRRPAGPASARVEEGRLREMAKGLREADEMVGRLRFQSAAILEAHPDYAFFGPAGGGEG